MSPAYRPAADVAVSQSGAGAAVYVAHLPAGPILVLEGPGAVIWCEATEGPAEGWISRVAETFDEPVVGIAADVLAFVRMLGSRDLLDEAESTPET